MGAIFPRRVRVNTHPVDGDVITSLFKTITRWLHAVLKVGRRVSIFVQFRNPNNSVLLFYEELWIPVF